MLLYIYGDGMNPVVALRSVSICASVLLPIMKIYRSLALLVAFFAVPLLPAQEVVPVVTGAPASAGQRLMRGAAAPEFTVLGAKGESVRLADFRGKIVLLDVSATWCGPCQAAMPNLDRIARKYADQGVVLLGVTASDTRENYDGWISRNAARYAFAMTFDPAGKDGWKDSVFNLGYGVTGFPTMFIIGRDGKLLETKSGGGPGDDFRIDYALARAGVKVDLASMPPEPKPNPAEPKSLPMVGKTPAMPAAKAAGAIVPMVGMGAPAPAAGAPAPSFVPAKFGSVPAGELVTDFTVTGADGKPVKLSSFRGKPLLLHFSTGNGPQPWLAETAAAYRAQGLAVLNIFGATEREAFDAWRAKNPDPGFAIAWDPAGKAWAEGVTNTGFGVGMFPVTVVIDSAGKLVSGTIGMGARAVTLAKAMLAKSKEVKLTADDAALVLDALLVADSARAAMPAAALKPMPGAPAGGGMMPAAARLPTLAAGAVAPDFVMKTIRGKDVRLSDFKGKIVILDFWATWCGPCIASFPHTQAVAAKYKDQDVVVLASGTSDTVEKFKEWIPANQAKYPDLVFTWDPNERGSATFDDRASSKLYRVVGIPTQFVIGRDGKIAATIVGYDKGDVRSEGALARLGVKVDPAIAAEGEKQLAKAAAADLARAAADKEAEKNPVPQFREAYGKLKAGEPVPDFTALRVDGSEVKFSELSKGKTVVLSFWSAGMGLPEAAQAFNDDWAKKYAAQGVLFVGVGAYGKREDFDKWYALNGPKISFPVLFDPAGALARPAKAPDQMNDEEKAAFKAASSAYYAKVIPMKITGGTMAPVPNNLVIDAKGNFLGFFVGAGPQSADSLGNLLLRGGVKLAAEDMPKKVFTAAETKAAPPEAKVEMLKVGAIAPDFTTTDIDGKPVKISDFKGKVVILDFWAPWCGPCIASMPHTQQVAATYKDQGVVVLGSCTSDSRANFEKWVTANREKYPDFIFSHDAAERTPERASRKLYGVSGIPTQFIIDREGKVAAITVGYMAGEVLLDAALAKAGIKVDAAILAKAGEDQKKRDSR